MLYIIHIFHHYPLGGLDLSAIISALTFNLLGLALNDLVKKLMESIDKPAFIKNELGVYLECNKNFENFLGLSRSEVVGKTVFDIEPTGLAHTDVRADKGLVEARQTQFYKTSVASASKSLSPIIFAKTVFF